MAIYLKRNKIKNLIQKKKRISSFSYPHRISSPSWSHGPWQLHWTVHGINMVEGSTAEFYYSLS